MRPGQAAPVFVRDARIVAADRHASMRPGQAAPVFSSAFRARRPRSSRFNEAGAGCPGIRLAERDGLKKALLASMRPGQAAPVFRRRPEYWRRRLALQ